MWIVTLPSIGGDDPALFAESIAGANELGTSDAVLFISFDDRQFGLWAGEDLGLSVDEIDQVLAPLGDALRASDVGGGVALTASNLEAAVDGDEIDPGPWSGGAGEEPVETIPFEPDDPGVFDPGPIVEPGPFDPGPFDPGPFEPGPGGEPFTERGPSGAPTPLVVGLLLVAGVAAVGMGGSWLAHRRQAIAGSRGIGRRPRRTGGRRGLRRPGSHRCPRRHLRRACGCAIPRRRSTTRSSRSPASAPPVVDSEP